MHPKLDALLGSINALCGCHVCHLYETNSVFCIDLVARRTYRTAIHPETVGLRLIECGFLYVDFEFLARDLIHAKFDHEFDIWADSREAEDYFLDISVDFTGEILVSASEMDDLDCDELARRFHRRFSDAIAIFDHVLHEAEDLPPRVVPREWGSFHHPGHVSWGGAREWTKGAVAP